MNRDQAIAMLARQPPGVREAIDVFLNTSEFCDYGHPCAMERVIKDLRAIEQPSHECYGDTHAMLGAFRDHCQCGAIKQDKPCCSWLKCGKPGVAKVWTYGGSGNEWRCEEHADYATAFVRPCPACSQLIAVDM